MEFFTWVKAETAKGDAIIRTCRTPSSLRGCGKLSKEKKEKEKESKKNHATRRKRSLEPENEKE
jgi:hypothetical protein